MKLNWEVTAEPQAFTMGVNRRGQFINLDDVKEFTAVDDKALQGDKLALTERTVPGKIADDKKAFYYLSSSGEDNESGED